MNVLYSMLLQAPTPPPGMMQESHGGDLGMGIVVLFIMGIGLAFVLISLSAAVEVDDETWDE